MHKVLYIGKIIKYDGYHNPDLHIEVEIEDKKEGKELSIHGVIGAKHTGNAVGGCGQIDMEFEHRNPKQNDRRTHNLIKPKQIEFANGWNKELWYELLEVWHKHHLNGMSAGCEHQEELWDAQKEVSIVTYNLNDETLLKQNKLKDLAMEQLTTNGHATLMPDEQEIVALKWALKLGSTFPLPEALAQYYKEKSRENKTIGWLYPTGSPDNTYGGKEHPEGLMCKPCPVCGYKYGSGWQHRELPESVIKFIENLPACSKEPAWV